ncbi:MAG: DUF4118 domain-containing protein [Oscillospiraceae bacterium]|nr:DUF4118 domain-containing protein [Oscillospiraceae bacterium]
MYKVVKDCAVTLLVMAAAFGVCLLLHYVLDMAMLSSAIFVLAVFIVALLTENVVYGVAASFIGVLAINFAFTFPYFKFNFTMPENILSAIIMIAVTVMSSMLSAQIRRQANLRAESEKEHMRANLLRAVGHDLRTPLTTIVGSSSAIIENPESFTEAQKLKMLQGIQEDAEWLARMVENLLSVTRLDGGNVKLLKSSTVLDELIDSVLLKFHKRHSEQKVEVDIPDDIVMIPMDAILIEQVLINLLDNAVEHADGMARLVLRVFVIDDKAVFEVADDGCGIPPERMKDIFKGYYSGGAPADTKLNSGIGLSVCSAIIKAHGGDIRAENNKNGGATFRFSLETEDMDG